MSEGKVFNRREFLLVTTTAGTGLFLAFSFPSDSAQSAESKDFTPNAFLCITPDNKITIWVTRSEMGQGVRTALPMILADELEADWKQIEIKQASPGIKFKGIRLRTSGSGSIAGSWLTLRSAGAAAREMLVSAAAIVWKVENDTCRAENGTILHVPSGRRLTYGQLAIAAAKLPLPEESKLKEPEDFRFIGRGMKRIDGANIVTGKAIYGSDIKIPKMLYAVIARSPVLGGKVLRINDQRAKAAFGVRAVIPVTKGIHHGVAVIADNTWAALKGRDVLEVIWDEGIDKDFDSVLFIRKLESATLKSEGFITRQEGEVEKSFASASIRLEAVYEYPFQAHAAVETMNCVADVKADYCEIWSGTQAPETAHTEVSNMLGLPPEAVKMNIPLLGGGFGRRLSVDYILESVEISKAVGSPVQVVWTRQDDMKFGFFHPATVCRLQAGLDEQKKVIVLTHKTASSDLSMFGPPILNAKQYTEAELPWGAFDNPYFSPAYQVEYNHLDSPIPTGAWRSVFYPQNIFARESFIDEIAFSVGKDPLDFRLELLCAVPPKTDRLKNRRQDLIRVLETAAERSNWGKPLAQIKAKRRGRGISCNIYDGETVMAQVAEVSFDEKGNLRVDRIVCAVDCGQVVNPLGLEAQIEGGIVWGLSAALYGKMSFRKGRAEQSTYKDFPVLRMNEMPHLEIHILPSDKRPFGIGEPPVPLVAPAVANAIFAATGNRVRRVPFNEWQFR